MRRTARLGQARKAYLRGTDGRLWGKPQLGAEAKYLLSGLAECWKCGGSLMISTRQHGRKRAHFYVCANARERGTCLNRAWLPMPAVDLAILQAVEDDLLTPERIVAAVKVAREQLTEQRHDLTATADELDTRLSTLTQEIDRLTLAIAQGAALDPILAALRAREGERAHLERRRQQLAQAVSPATAFDRELERLQRDVARWRELLRAHVPQARQVLKKASGRESFYNRKSATA